MWNKACKFLFIITPHSHSTVVTTDNNLALEFYSVCIYIYTYTYM